MLKKGDKVRVKSASFFQDRSTWNKRPGFVDSMFRYCGNFYTVRNDVKSSEEYIFFDEDGEYVWMEWMVERVNKQLELF